VHSNGALRVEHRENMFMHESQITHFGGTGKYVFDAVHSCDERTPKQQGPGRRWSYVPWTRAQEESYGKARLVEKLKVNTKVGLRRKCGVDEDVWEGTGIQERKQEKRKMERLMGELT
jgi:hypothetical protein